MYKISMLFSLSFITRTFAYARLSYSGPHKPSNIWKRLRMFTCTLTLAGILKSHVIVKSSSVIQSRSTVYANLNLNTRVTVRVNKLIIIHLMKHLIKIIKNQKDAN